MSFLMVVVSSLVYFLGDQKIRRGLKEMPMVQFLDLTDVDAVLHQWLRDLGNMEKIIYRFNARDKFPKRTPTMEAGVKMTKEAALAVQLAKLNFREEALEKLQLILDTPDPAGHGGSSDDGNAAKKFFGYEDRDAVVSFFKVDISFFFFSCHFAQTSKYFRILLQMKRQTFGNCCKTVMSSTEL